MRGREKDTARASFARSGYKLATGRGNCVAVGTVSWLVAGTFLLYDTTNIGLYRMACDVSATSPSHLSLYERQEEIFEIAIFDDKKKRKRRSSLIQYTPPEFLLYLPWDINHFCVPCGISFERSKRTLHRTPSCPTSPQLAIHKKIHSHKRAKRREGR